MKTIHIFLIFVLAALIQLFVPAQMILNRETVLKEGTVYKFKTRPIDPNDPFRGKYITLQYDIDTLKTSDTLWQRTEEAYVYFIKDANGFAEATRISREKLDLDEDYVIAEISWYDKNKQEVRVNFPFNRYYIEESKAEEAEEAYRIAQTDSLPDNTYALVHIKNGTAVLADVLIDDVSIKDHVLNNRK